MKIMPYKIQHKYITFLTAVMAYISNSFTLTLPYVVNQTPFSDLEYSPANLVEANSMLLICQHLGVLIGAIVFSFWVDKKGRLVILLISVFTYSMGTFLGGFINNYYLFLILRFIVGFGLAPEIGIGIVLVCEIFDRRRSSILVAVSAIGGFSAVILLSLAGKYFHWRDIYFSVGISGLLIMISRFASFESDIFTKIKKETFQINSLKTTLKSRNFLFLFLCMPPVYVLTASSTFIVKGLEEAHNIILPKEVLFILFSASAIVGFVLIPFLSQYLRSRLKVFRICLTALIINALIIYFYLSFYETSSNFVLYIVILSNGFFCGYLFEFFIYAVEQFGTNRRGSATTLLFAFGRSSVFVFSLLIQLVNNLIYKNLLNTIISIEMPIFLIALWVVFNISEDYNKNLDFVD
jgi:MFS transporter, putative metabolite:H+ symporter